jgi:hypothetical protein
MAGIKRSLKTTPADRKQTAKNRKPADRNLVRPRKQFETGFWRKKPYLQTDWTGKRSEKQFFDLKEGTQSPNLTFRKMENGLQHQLKSNKGNLVGLNFHQEMGPAKPLVLHFGKRRW